VFFDIFAEFHQHHTYRSSNSCPGRFRKIVEKIRFRLQSFNTQRVLPTFLQLKCAICLNLMVSY